MSITSNSSITDGFKLVRKAAILTGVRRPRAARARAIGAGRSCFAPPVMRKAMAVAAFLLALLPMEAVQAGLGENTDSLVRDHAEITGALIVTAMQAYDVHQIVSSTGITVREYATHAGRIFAVTWTGSQVPDLKNLLGSYFERYVSLARTHRMGHHVLSVNTPDLVMTSIRVQRTAVGQAYVPALMPSGVSRRELR